MKPPEKTALKAVLVAFFMLVAGATTAVADGVIVPVPPLGYPVIKYHHVTVTIENQHAVTVVDQKFYNPYDVEMVGTYIFPVPEGGFVSNFTVIIDGAEYRARSLSKEEAKEFFERAVNEHKDVSLLEYIGRELFSIRVTIPPKGYKQMSLRYEEFLIPWGGMYRYTYTLSTERYSAVDLEEVSITVNISSENGVQNIYSPTHEVMVKQLSPTEVRVHYFTQNTRPDRDFELYYTTSDTSFGAGWLTYFDNGQGFFLFTFSPNPDDFEGHYIPKDIVFVIDRSGSMSGEKIAQAKDALKFILQQLGENDRYTIVSFNSEINKLSNELISVSSANISKALEYVDNLYADGSTDINGALLEGLSIFSGSAPSGSARIVVFLTDGLPTKGVMDEDQIATNVKNANVALEKEASIYVFGVGYDVNTHLLDKISGRNHGFSIYVEPGESLEKALTDFYSKIENPLLTDVNISFSGVEVSEVYPREVPDLFAGSQIVLVGKFSKAGNMIVEGKTIGDPSDEFKRGYVVYTIVIKSSGMENVAKVTAVISGNTPNGPTELSYEFELTYAEHHDFIPRLWATRKIGDLVNQIRLEGEKENLVEEIKELGMKYGIVTPYTSMLVQAESGTLQEYMSDSYMLKQRSGDVSFNNAKANQSYNFAMQANVSQGANITAQGGKIFADLGGVHVDMNLLSNINTISLDNQTAQEWVASNLRVTKILVQGSPEYFEFAMENNMGEVLATGENIVFYHEGEVIQVSSELRLSSAGSGDEVIPIVSIPGNDATSPIGSLVRFGLVAGLTLMAVLVRR
jgi:Ca-activated chloride channel family protein